DRVAGVEAVEAADRASLGGNQDRAAAGLLDRPHGLDQLDPLDAVGGQHGHPGAGEGTLHDSSSARGSRAGTRARGGETAPRGGRRPAVCPPPAPGTAAGVMRAVFGLYLVLIVAGIAYFLAIGLLRQ